MALVACVLWLAGVEALPAVHEALHGGLAAHRHESGSIVVTSFEDTTHRHPDGSIHVVTRPARAVDPAVPEGGVEGPGGVEGARGVDGATRVDGAHADGLAHHAAALAPVAPPVTQPLPIDRRPSTLAVAHALELVTQDPLAPSARGPPSA